MFNSVQGRRRATTDVDRPPADETARRHPPMYDISTGTDILAVFDDLISE